MALVGLEVLLFVLALAIHFNLTGIDGAEPHARPAVSYTILTANAGPSGD